VRFLGSYPRAHLAGTGEGVATVADPGPGQTVKDYTEAAAWLTALRDGTGA
jgi:prephenate dehydratase